MKKLQNFLNEFKVFISRGNVMDMAVGVIIGGAFKGIIDSLVKDIIMPIISIFIGGLDFSNLFIALDGNYYDTIAHANEADVTTINYGSFITVVINFLLMALVIFFMIKGMNKLAGLKKHENPQPSAPTTKICPFCKSEISIDATRCAHCTSEL